MAFMWPMAACWYIAGMEVCRAMMLPAYPQMIVKRLQENQGKTQ